MVSLTDPKSQPAAKCTPLSAGSPREPAATCRISRPRDASPGDPWLNGIDSGPPRGERRLHRPIKRHRTAKIMEWSDVNLLNDETTEVIILGIRGHHKGPIVRRGPHMTRHHRRFLLYCLIASVPVVGMLAATAATASAQTTTAVTARPSAAAAGGGFGQGRDRKARSRPAPPQPTRLASASPPGRPQGPDQRAVHELVRLRRHRHAAFSKVSASWTEPSATCSSSSDAARRVLGRHRRVQQRQRRAGRHPHRVLPGAWPTSTPGGRCTRPTPSRSWARRSPPATRSPRP